MLRKKSIFCQVYTLYIQERKIRGTMIDFFTIMNQYKYSTKPLDPKRVEASAVEKPYTTVPIIDKKPIDANAKLTPEGNVPLVKQQNDNTTGINVEKRNIQHSRKGPTFNQALTNFYGDKYTAASDEEKEKMAVRFFDWLNKDKKEEISQLDQFKLYRERCTDDNEYKLLSSIIDKMEAQYQTKAAKTVITEGTERQKDIGTKAVADDYQNYDSSNQVEVSQLITGSKNKTAIEIAAGHSSEVAKENQTEVVNVYANAYVNQETGKIDKKDEASQQKINEIMINQYGNYAKENQVDIHNIMSNSQLSATVEYAASNIYNFDKENQAAAVQITVNTKNEAAINAAASKWQYYDKTAQEEIKSTIYSAGYDSANQTLAKAELNSVVENKNVETEIVEAKEASISSESIEQVKESIKKQDIKSINQQVKTLSNSEKIVLLKECPSPELVKAILNTNPSLDVLAKIDEAYLKDSGYKRLGNQIGFLSASAQLYIVKDSAANHELGSLSRYLLKSSVKCEYDKLMNENKERNVA